MLHKVRRFQEILTILIQGAWYDSKCGFKFKIQTINKQRFKRMNRKDQIVLETKMSSIFKPFRARRCDGCHKAGPKPDLSVLYEICVETNHLVFVEMLLASR